VNGEMKITIEMLDKNNNVKIGLNDANELSFLMKKTGEDLVFLATKMLAFEAGDSIRVQTSEPNQYLMVKLDETLMENLIYLQGNVWEYKPMLTERGKKAQVDTAFQSKRHYVHVRRAKPFEIANYQNLAFNPHDQKDDTGAYPHAFANVETRDDATFFARNVIDGIYANNFHGSYPYQSWGINQQKDATLTLDFGRSVQLDALAFTVRADFPHDSYWTDISVQFDNELTRDFQLKKTSMPQYFTMEPVICHQLTLKHLIKDIDTSPFPALTQLAAYGVNGVKIK